MQCAADLGGTNLRLQFYSADSLISSINLKTADYQSFSEALRSSMPAEIRRLSCAVAGPVKNGTVRCGNIPWPEITQDDLKREFDLEAVTLINDLHAAALALLECPLNLRCLIGATSAGAKLLIGVGTGLGVALISAGGEIIPTECGWATFAPRSLLDMEFVNFVKKKKIVDRVAVEHVTAGPSVSLWYEFFGGGVCTPEDIYQMNDEISIKAVRMQWMVLGRIISEWSMMFSCAGGVYLTGGVVEKAGGLIDEPLVEGFLASLGKPTVLDELVRACSVNVVLTSDMPLRGAKLLLT